MDKAVVLVSGGINSAVAAAVACDHYEAAFLHVAWEHRTAARELSCFQQLCSAMKIEKSLVADLGCLSTMGGSGRATKRIAVEDAVALGRGTPASYTPGLMSSMLSLAVSWAGAIRASKVVVGISENHDVGTPAIGELYPDHRKEFIQAFNVMLHYALPAQHAIRVEAPLLEMDRPEVLRLGESMDVSFDHTWSCYRNNDTPCGRCLPCVARHNGFARANKPDPLMLVAAGAK